MTKSERKWHRKEKLLAIIRRYKVMKKCIDCGYNDHFYALEFDHISNEKKLGNIPHLIKRNFAWNTIKNEINKCEVVCSCCHRIRTYNRKQFGEKRNEK